MALGNSPSLIGEFVCHAYQLHLPPVCGILDRKYFNHGKSATLHLSKLDNSLSLTPLIRNGYGYKEQVERDIAEVGRGICRLTIAASRADGLSLVATCQRRNGQSVTKSSRCYTLRRGSDRSRSSLYFCQNHNPNWPPSILPRMSRIMRRP